LTWLEEKNSKAIFDHTNHVHMYTYQYRCLFG